MPITGLEFPYFFYLCLIHYTHTHYKVQHNFLKCDIKVKLKKSFLIACEKKSSPLNVTFLSD